MVTWVCFGGLLQLRDHLVRSSLPVTPEPGVRPASSTDFLDFGWVGLIVYGKVVQINRSAECQDNELLRMVQSDVACWARCAVEDIDGLSVVGFDKSTSVFVACKFVMGGVDVLVAGS